MNPNRSRPRSGTTGRPGLRGLLGGVILGGHLLHAGCAVIPLATQRAQVDTLIAERSGIAGGDLSLPPQAGEIASGPLDRDAAVLVALRRSPRLQGEYARLGLVHADLIQASRLANPSLSLGVLFPEGGAGVERLAAGLVQRFAAAVTLPARKRLAAAALERATLAIAAAGLELARDVDRAWLDCAAATAVAAMREEVRVAAELSATLAARYHAAGNLSELDLAREQADAADARLAAIAAAGAARAACLALNETMGLASADPARVIPATPPAVPPDDPDTATLAGLARAGRLDIAAARTEVARREAALATSGRFRLLGDAAVGVEYERDTDGTKTLGPTLELELPLFDQGQGRIARAQARLDLARAALAEAELRADHEVADAAARMADARRAAAEIDTHLLRERRAVVDAVARRVNYMLLGVFDQIVARREYYAAVESAIGATRDYWLARVDLEHAAGGRLAGIVTAAAPPLDIEALLGAGPARDGHRHGHPDAAAPEVDPHAGHGAHPAGAR